MNGLPFHENINVLPLGLYDVIIGMHCIVTSFSAQLSQQNLLIVLMMIETLG